jgi:hypothetical protein
MGYAIGLVGRIFTDPVLGFECAPADFCRAVQAARVAKANTFHSEPQWVGYWSFPVKDAMGNTVEITTPQRDAWPPSN